MGGASPSQAYDGGSIPLTRSNAPFARKINDLAFSSGAFIAENQPLKTLIRCKSAARKGFF